MIAQNEPISHEWEEKLRAIGIVDYSDHNREDALSRLTSDTALMELTRRISSMQAQLPNWYFECST